MTPGTHRIDALASRHLDGGGLDEGIDRTVDHRGRRSRYDGIAVEHPRRERKGPSIRDVFPPDQDQIDLAHELVLETERVVVVAHLTEWREFDRAGGRNHGIDRTELLEGRSNRLPDGDVQSHCTRGTPRRDYIVAFLQLRDNCFPDCPRRSHYQYLS